MKEWNTSESGQEDRGNLEDRLAAYYGPELPEQPLSTTSWVQLRSRLPRQRSFRHRSFRLSGRPRRRIRFMHFPRLSYGGAMPVYVQDAFERIVHEAGLTSTPEMLHCTYKKQVQIPSVRVSYWGKRKIHLILPATMTRSLEPEELNVLLAAGLAKHLLLIERRLPFGLVRMLTIWTCLLALIVLDLDGRQQSMVITFPIATILIVVIFWVLVLTHLQGRALAFRVDALMVQWLGRDRVCQGLHALVRRSRRPQRKGFGRVSFDERIERVCGTRVAAQSERLTLVR
jgi:hypothetical protein